MQSGGTGHAGPSGKRPSAIPIIALTAHALVEDRERAKAAGCDDFDTKPVELPRLLEKINRLLAQRAGGR
jgi:CheY-like chemotaxis protein